MLQIIQFNFLTEAEAATTGEEMANEQGGILTLAVSGTFEGANVSVQGQLGGEWYNVAVVKLSDLTTAEAITAAGSYSVAGVEGFEKIRTNLTEITSGSVTIIGRLCY